MHPLPELGAGDLRRGGVLHEVEDGHRALAAQPRLDVTDADLNGVDQTRVRGARVEGADREQVGGRHRHVLAQPVLLVRAVAEHGVEGLPGDRHQVRVGDPGAVEAVVRLAVLVGAHLLERDPVDLRVPPGRDERRHAADRVRAPPVAGADQEFGVRAHERSGHRHRVAVREHELGPGGTEVLDQGEQIVPAARVQPRGVLAEFVEDLVHLERRRDRLDQDGGPDRAARDAEVVLREDEHVVPETRLQMRLRLREVEVRALAEVEQPARVVEEVQPEVDERPRDPGPVLPVGQMAFVQVPAARAHDRRGQLGVGAQDVRLAAAVVGEVDGATVGVDQIELAQDHVLPGGRGGVLEVGEPDAGTGVERVDGHLPVGGAGDLDPAVLQGGRRGGHPPGVVRADRGRLGEEVQPRGTGDLGAALRAAGEEFVTAGCEPAVQLAQEGERPLRQHLLLPGQGRGGAVVEDDDGRRGRHGCGHAGVTSLVAVFCGRCLLFRGA